MELYEWNIPLFQVTIDHLSLRYGRLGLQNNVQYMFETFCLKVTDGPFIFLDPTNAFLWYIGRKGCELEM